MKLRPRFTLKAILWLMLIVAAGSHGWRLYREHQEQETPELGGTTELATHALGKYYISTITETDLLQCPSWDQDAENPPISARKALYLATKMKDSLVKDEAGCKWPLLSVELYPASLGRWVWVAKYRRTLWFGAVAPFDELAIVVMMDGTVIKPKVSNVRYAEPDDGPREGLIP